MRSAKAVGLVCGLVVYGHSIGSATQEPTFRVASELVVIDLVAVDRQGGFVSDLRPDEIEVEENGTRQAVQLLRLVGQRGAAGAAAAVPTAEPFADALTRPLADESPVTVPSRRIAIVVDTLSLTVDALPRVRESLLGAVADLPDGLPVLLATVGPDLHVTQSFTTDKDLLRQAVSALPTQLDAPAGVSRIFDAVDRVCAAADPRRVVEVAIDAGQQMVADAQARSAVSSEALAMLADRLGAFEGRKHLVLYSAGHAMSPLTQAADAVGAAVSACTELDTMAVRRDASSALGSRTNRAASDGLRRVIDRANRAQVTFYTLDPAGVTTSTILPSSRGTALSGGSGPLIAFAGLTANAGRDYVEGLALETGGLTLKSNDMALVLRRAWEDATQYYLVGYPPSEATRDGDVRKISVSVKRRGVSVRFRRGYIDSRAPTAGPVRSEADQAIEEALASPTRVATESIVVTPSVQDGTLSVEVLVPHDTITFSEHQGRHEADFAVHAVLRDRASPPRTTDLPGKRISLRLTPEEYRRITSAVNLRVVLSAPAPKAVASLTVVVSDAAGWIGAREVPCCEVAPITPGDTGSTGADIVLDRAASYVDQFVGRFSNVVLQESLTQTATSAPSALGGTRILTPGTTTTRRLRSDFLLVRPPSSAFWLAFRDVVEVDGRSVTDRQRRLEQLFLHGTRSGLAEAQRIAAEGSRFLLNARPRTTTSPVFALAFLQAHHQPRFRYRVEPAPDGPDSRWILSAEEVMVPTLLRTDLGDNLPLRARYEIDAMTGTVHMSEVSLKTLGDTLVLRTRFTFDARAQTFTPAEMTEEHTMRSGARTLTVATYGALRSFAVTTSEDVP